MSPAPTITVRNRTEQLGVLLHPEDLAVGSEARIPVVLAAGPVVLVPVDLMVQEDDGNFFLDLTAAEAADLETADEEGDDEDDEVDPI